MNSLRIFVPGVPQPKGSKIALGRGQMIEGGTSNSRKRKKTWAHDVKTIAAAARKRNVISTPVSVEILFTFPIPKSRLRGARKIQVGEPHAQKSDIDKLVRNTLDPLTDAGVISDDSIVAELSARKRWCAAGDEGAEIIISW